MSTDEKIGPYRLIEPLGSGGMGTVWRAWDERLKRPVALKRILTATEDPRVRERFRREAEAGARLNHPAIVHIYDIVETEASDWIVMELVDGWTLQELLREGPLDPQRTLRLGREIADGLAEAHDQGFIHRDLKALNVMVTRTGHAKILDFGVAKQIQPEAQETTLSAPGTVVGTSYAMSPEQAMGLPLDARSDLFSLGSLLYEMVTGVAPFRAENATATLARVCSFRQSPVSIRLPDVPHELSDLIDRLLEKDSVDRPASALEVSLAFGEIIEAGASPSRVTERTPALLEGEPTLADVLPLAVRDDRPGSTQAPRRLRRIGAGTGLLLLLLLPASYLISRKSAPADPYTLYQEGQGYLRRYDRKGNLDKAIDRFQRILSQDNHHAAAHAALAKAYWMKLLGESKDPIWLDRALPMAQRAVELDNHLAMAWVSLGLVHSSTGRRADAMRDFNRALRLEPLNADAWYGLGRAYEAEGKMQAAESAHRKAIENRPDRMYYDELGSLYYRAGRTREAIRAFEKSIELAPDTFYGYRNLGAAYYALGDLAQAAAQFQKALQIQPDATLYGNLGNLYFAQGFYQQAVEAFEKALEMPGGANSYLQWGNLADACRWTPDKKEKAREVYRQAIQMVRGQLRASPRDVTLRSHLALYLAKSGDLAEARSELDGIEKAASGNAAAQYRMAVAYEVIADREAALAAAGKALREGFPLEEIRRDPELLALRADRRYHELAAAFIQP